MQKGSAILWGALFAAVCAGTARADIFTINPLQSILTIASANLAGSPATAQPPSGFTTSYTGTIDATVTPLSIQFNSANADAMVSGTYSPAVGGGAGTAPGDYGGQFTVGGIFPGTFAIRGLVASLSSPALTLTGPNFDAMQLLFTAVAGAGDYRVAALAQMGSIALTGTTMNAAAMAGTLTTTGGMQVLTIPIDVTLIFTALNPNDSMIRFTGSIMAAAPIPEPATYLLLGLGLLACAIRFRRGKK